MQKEIKKETEKKTSVPLSVSFAGSRAITALEMEAYEKMKKDPSVLAASFGSARAYTSLEIEAYEEMRKDPTMLSSSGFGPMLEPINKKDETNEKSMLLKGFGREYLSDALKYAKENDAKIYLVQNSNSDRNLPINSTKQPNLRATCINVVKPRPNHKNDPIFRNPDTL
ncbi:MAG: hypothetical protein ABIH83_05220 [Candidatus Micrarchaeota archaeon]